MLRPRVLTVTRRTIRKSRLIDYTGELHLELLIRFRTLPVMVPVAKGTEKCLEQYINPMHGLLLVEGEDIGPRNFRARKENYQYLENTHPLKDKLELRLLRYALRHRIPILGICRGSQMLNVACGGTLYGDVQREKRSHRQHINYHNYDTYRHPVTLEPDTPLHQWYRRKQMKVNSYHHQGIRRLASRFAPMAWADDGLIEAFHDPGAAFTVGLQFHPERMLKEHKGSLRVWEAFARAVHRKFRQEQ
ncbi:MAG: gamma-glutamyl-gamma-aminobutyrate hydrolase family protein [bacterium]